MWWNPGRRCICCILPGSIYKIQGKEGDVCRDGTLVPRQLTKEHSSHSARREIRQVPSEPASSLLDQKLSRLANRRDTLIKAWHVIQISLTSKTPSCLKAFSARTFFATQSAGSPAKKGKEAVRKIRDEFVSDLAAGRPPIRKFQLKFFSQYADNKNRFRRFGITHSSTTNLPVQLA
jgi:hypothetical protein